MNSPSFWPGSKTPRSTGNAFDLSLPSEITWGKLSQAHRTSVQTSTFRSNSATAMTFDRPVGSAEENLDLTKVQIKKPKPVVKTSDKPVAKSKPKTTSKIKPKTTAKTSDKPKSAATKKSAKTTLKPIARKRPANSAKARSRSEHPAARAR